MADASATATSPSLHLYSHTTPNGYKVVWMLEHMKAAGIIPGYELHPIDISKGEQFSDEFLAISPNGKIPALVDNSTDVKVFESGTILTYLAETYDTAATLLPPTSKPAERYSVLQWMTWQVAGLGPMFGQMFHFLRYAKEDVPYGKKRYTDESNRLLAVLDKQLEASGSGYVCSTGLSIADFAIAPWVAIPYKKMGGKGPLDWSKAPNVVKYCELIESNAAYAAATAEPDA